MASDDDFSFPIIKHPSSQSAIDSPPLWHLSPASSHVSSTTGAQDDDDSLCFPEKTLNFLKQRTSRRSCSDSEKIDSEEKMDVLWEDFNEELLSSSSSDGKTGISYGNHLVDMGCVDTLKLSRRNSSCATGVGAGGGRGGGGGLIVPPRGKPGLVVFIEVLKKIFLLQKNSCPYNRHGKKKAWRSN